MIRQKVLLSGSAGFIGSNFTRKVCHEKHPYELFSVDKITNSSFMNNIYQHKLHEFWLADICDEHVMNKIFEYVQPDIVIHMAAESSVDKSIKDPTVFVKSNVVGTQVLINLALEYKVQKFIYISTDEVYGALQSVDEPVWSEAASISPRNPYSASKAAGEMLVQAAGKTHNLPYIITRSCNNYGWRQTSDKLIPRVIKHILEDKPVPVYGKGEQVRDWIHTQDNCAAILKIMEKGEIGQIYNISANEEHSNIDVVNKLIKMIGKGSIEFVEDRLGHDFRYGIDASKLRALNWNPIYKFENGLEHTISFYLNNRWFLTN